MLKISEHNKARILFSGYILVLWSFDNRLSFMMFNSFLAYIALELAFLLPYFSSKKKMTLPVGIIVYAAFILMSPNVFYIVTDMIHFNQFKFHFMEGIARKEWWNFTLLAAGVFISLYFYILMIRQLRLVFTKQSLYCTAILLFVLLESVGIYMGRFLRFHSIHIFTDPQKIIRIFADSITKDAILFIGWMTILQLLVIWMFRAGGKTTTEEADSKQM